MSSKSSGESSPRRILSSASRTSTVPIRHGRAGAARLLGGLFHVVVEPVDQADCLVEDEETAIAEERPDGVTLVEVVELLQS